MDITEQVKDTTVGKLAAFVLQVLESGAALDAPVVLQKSRGKQVVAITVSMQTRMPFDSSAAAATMLRDRGAE